MPLCRLFGGAVRASVPILRILAIKTPNEMAIQAQKPVDKGYRYLKMKGNCPGLSIQGRILSRTPRGRGNNSLRWSRR
jgi:L-alanine-DL-glutamate epimerase-like enolase superfamily enzyme